MGAQSVSVRSWWARFRCSWLRTGLRPREVQDESMTTESSSVIKPGARFVVTGAAGFIASHLIDQLLRAGVEVVGFDDLSSGREENVAE
ncbi:MAG: NAD-dependent epimerase/dehydratase family protein, partial [Actinomycetes bacterium]